MFVHLADSQKLKTKSNGEKFNRACRNHSTNLKDHFDARVQANCIERVFDLIYQALIYHSVECNVVLHTKLIHIYKHTNAYTTGYTYRILLNLARFVAIQEEKLVNDVGVCAPITINTLYMESIACFYIVCLQMNIVFKYKMIDAISKF